MSRRAVLVLAIGLFPVRSLLAAEPARGTTYTLDPAASVLLVVTRKDASAVLASAAHDHAVRATGWAGEVVHDPADPGRCRIELRIPVAGLRADEPEMRRKAGLKGTMLEKNRDDIESAMRAEDQLDAEHFPSITFVAERCTGASGAGGTATVVGDLTIHGRTKRFEVPVKFRVDEKTLAVRGQLAATHADFGMKPYSAGLGAIRNREELMFLFELKAVAR